MTEVQARPEQKSARSVFSTAIADFRAFLASALREWRTLRRYRFTFAGILFWPAAGPAIYVAQGYGFAGGSALATQAFADKAGSPDIAAFIYIGWSAYMWLSVMLWGPGTALRTEQIRGTLEAVLLTPSSRLAVLFGPAVAHLITAFVSYAVIGTTLVLVFGVRFDPAAVVRALVVLVVAVPAFYGIGVLFAAAVLRLGEVFGAVQFVRGLFALFCGMTFPILALPEWAQKVALALPPTYLIADVRAVLLRGAQFVQFASDLGILLAMGVALCALAAVAFAWTERYARRGGTLAQY